MESIPGAEMTGGTVTTGDEVLTNRQADQNTVHIVTAETIVMSIGCRTGQGVIVTAGTAGRCHLNHGAVVRCIGDMGGFPRCRMTGSCGTKAAWPA